MAHDAHASVETLLQRLDQLTMAELRLQWRNHLGGQPPDHLPRWLFMRLLAYRVQVAVYGGLSSKALRLIRQSGRGGDADFEIRSPQSREGVDLKPGTVLVREWRGQLHHLMVLSDGFAWNGEAYGSLSRVARAITGTNWNGHRFFGLRQPKSAGRMKASDSDVARRLPCPRASSLTPYETLPVAERSLTSNRDPVLAEPVSTDMSVVGASP